MATKFSKRSGRKELGAGQDSDRSSHVDTGLPVLAFDPQGSQWGAALRPDAGEPGLDTSLRDDAGGGATRGEWQDSFKALFGDCRRLRISGLGNGGHSERIEESSLPDSGPIELTQFPHVSNRYLEPLEETASEVAGDGLRGGDAVLDSENNYRYLATLRTKALRVLGETLDVRTPNENDADYARVLSIKKDAAINIVSASLKADENCFRQRHNDALARLYAAVKKEAPQALTIDVTPA